MGIYGGRKRMWGGLEPRRSHRRPNFWGKSAERKALKYKDRFYTRAALREMEGRRRGDEEK